MLIFQEFNGYLVIKDYHNEINVDELNQVINSELKNRSDIYIDDTVKRAIVKQPYIILFDHASLAGRELIKFIKAYLLSNDTVWTYGKFTEADFLIIEDMLPRNNVLGGTKYGSICADTQSIDCGVVRICEAINTMNGIDTFASCDGHAGFRPLYVAFTAKDLSSLEDFTKQFVTTLNEEHKKRSFVKQVNISSSFNWGEWQTGSRLYFDFKIYYDHVDTKEVFNLVDDVAKKLMINKKSS